MNVPTTVWITKWALTLGIKKAEGCVITDGGYASRDSGHCTSPNYVFVRMGKDAFLSEEEAVANTLTRIEKRCKALDREKAKLEALAKTLKRCR
jgi:hypothetical protein